MSGQDSTPRAVVYHRVARDTPETPDTQRLAAREAAGAAGYEVVAEYPNGPPCRDCGVLPGTPHQDGCDVARCLWTGMQRLSCDREDHEDAECGWDVWTGVWPGEADCIRLGWYSKFTDHGWVQCGPDDPEAGPNLNRLAVDARWDRETHRWEQPAPSAKDYAASHPVVCAHADQDGGSSHMLAPGEKCTRGGREDEQS